MCLQIQTVFSKCPFIAKILMFLIANFREMLNYANKGGYDQFLLKERDPCKKALCKETGITITRPVFMQSTKKAINFYQLSLQFLNFTTTTSFSFAIV